MAKMGGRFHPGCIGLLAGQDYLPTCGARLIVSLVLKASASHTVMAACEQSKQQHVRFHQVNCRAYGRSGGPVCASLKYKIPTAALTYRHAFDLALCCCSLLASVAAFGSDWQNGEVLHCCDCHFILLQWTGIFKLLNKLWRVGMWYISASDSSLLNNGGTTSKFLVYLHMITASLGYRPIAEKWG